MLESKRGQLFVSCPPGQSRPRSSNTQEVYTTGTETFRFPMRVGEMTKHLKMIYFNLGKVKVKE